MAAESVGQIGLDLVVNDKSFKKQMTGIEGLAKKAGAALAGAFAIKKIAGFGKQCLELGSDLQEVQNVVDVTFPNMRKQVNSFARDAASSFGLSETMAKRFTGTFGAMAKAFGFGEKAAYEMSTTLTGLAGDVASFYNISQDEAYTKLKSVFTGETESLKDLGVVMTQSALDSYALANGYGKVTTNMSEAEKVALRYKFVQDQLSSAKWDFARTSDSWANQIRVLQLQFDSLKATIGQGLINALTPVIKVINTIIARLVTLADYFRAFTAALFGNAGSDAAASMADSMASAASSAGTAAANMGKTASAADKTKKALGATGIDELNILKAPEESSGSGGDAGGGGASIAPIETEDISIPDIDTSGVEKAAERIKSAFEKLRTFMKENKNAILAIVGGLAAGIAAYFAASNWDVIVAGVIKAFSGLGRGILTAIGSISPVAVAIAAVVGLVVAGIIDLWNTSDTFRANMKRCWEMVSGAVTNAWSMIWNRGLKPLGTALADLAKTLYAFYETSGLKSLFEVVITGIAGVVSYVGSVLITSSSTVITLIMNTVTVIITLFTDLINTVMWVAENWSAIWNSISSFFVGLWNSLCTLVSGAVKSISGGINNAWNAVLTTTTKTWTAIKTFFTQWWNQVNLLIQNILLLIQNDIQAVWMAIQNTWTNVWTAIKDFFAQIWESIKVFVSTTIEEIHAKISTVVDGIKNGISEALENIKTSWTNTWQSLKDTTAEIFEKMWSTIKGIINSIIGGIETMVNSVISGINKMIEAVNEVADKIPGIDAEFIPKIPKLDLPRLAQGGFARANTPQLAMIGDNRHYGEIVAPEDKMQDMVNRAVAMASQSNGMSDQYLLIMIDLLKKIIELIEAMDLTVTIDIREVKKRLVELEKRSGHTMRKA